MDKENIKRVEMLEDFEYELKRFQIKFEEALIEAKNAPEWSYYNPKWASLKRASLDMKKELSKITQWTNYFNNL